MDKELELGRDLINKATEKVTREYLEKLGAIKDLTEADHDLIDIHFRILDLVSDGESTAASWEVNSERLTGKAQ